MNPCNKIQVIMYVPHWFCHYTTKVQEGPKGVMLPALAQTSALRGAIPSSSAVLSSSSSDSLSLAAENPKSLLLHISSFHHSSKVPAVIQPVSLASLDMVLVFTLLDSLFFSWLPPPVLFLAHCRNMWMRRPQAASPVAANHTELLQISGGMDYSSFPKNKAPVSGSQITALDTLHLERESPQLIVFIVLHCWIFPQMSWFSSAARSARNAPKLHSPNQRKAYRRIFVKLHFWCPLGHIILSYHLKLMSAARLDHSSCCSSSSWLDKLCQIREIPHSPQAPLHNSREPQNPASISQWGLAAGQHTATCGVVSALTRTVAFPWCCVPFAISY